MRVSSNKLLQKYAQPTSHNAVTLLSAQNLSDSNFPEAADMQKTPEWEAAKQAAYDDARDALEEVRRKEAGRQR
jgi:hypothetical protein